MRGVYACLPKCCALTCLGGCIPIVGGWVQPWRTGFGWKARHYSNACSSRLGIRWWVNIPSLKKISLLKPDRRKGKVWRPYVCNRVKEVRWLWYAWLGLTESWCPLKLFVGHYFFLFLFSNQREESQETLLITVKTHQGAVYCCHFSQDASKVVSCGADKTVKVCTGIPS